jgi:Predicted transcriptional regulators
MVAKKRAVAPKKKEVAHLVEWLPVSELKAHPRNYRHHPEDELEHLAESIRENGIYKNILIAKDNTILAGHGVVEASRLLGLKKIPTVRLNISPDSPRALKILAADNAIAHLAEDNDRVFSELLKEIKERDKNGLLGTGYDEMMLANLLFITRPKSEVEDLDEAAHWVGLPEYQAGEVPIKAVITFRSKKDRDALVKLLEVHHFYGSGNTMSFWWPEREHADRASVRFEETEAP